jgi:chromosome condensin MukBEF ATPase and DNA-binding subunit MukB
MTPTDTTTAPQWVQVVLSVLGVLGGASGLAAIAAVVAQRGKFKAEAADMLTDAALTLVQPMRVRVAELEAEAQAAREQLRTAREQAERATATLSDLHAMLDRWYALIFAVTFQ